MNRTLQNFVNGEAVTPVVGVIKSVQGTNPGPCAGITYTLLVNMPDGGVVEVAGIKPSHSRPRAADIDAAEVGTMVSGYVMAGTLYMTIHEDYTGGGCP